MLTLVRHQFCFLSVIDQIFLPKNLVIRLKMSLGWRVGINNSFPSMGLYIQNAVFLNFTENVRHQSKRHTPSTSPSNSSCRHIATHYVLDLYN